MSFGLQAYGFLNAVRLIPPMQRVLPFVTGIEISKLLV